MITKSKRILTAVLNVIMLMTTLVPLSAFAADGVTMDLSKAEVSWDYTLTDYDGNVFSAAYGVRAEDNPFGGAIAPMNRKMHDYTAKRLGLGSDRSQWVYGQDYVYCFCIEHGVPLPNSGEYSGSSDPSHGNKYEILSENQKNLLSLALAYGYPNRTELQNSKDANACYAATQLIVWQITLGFRTSSTQLNDKSYPMSGYTGTMTEQYCRNQYFKQWYDLILSDMQNHTKRPSFTSNVPASAKTYEMEYVNGRYTLTLTDNNGVLSKYWVSASGGVSASISGNTLTISSAQPINKEITIKLNRKMPSTNHTTGFLIWSVPGKEAANQDMVSGVPVDNDPVPSYLKVQTASGSVKIVKISEDGKVDGVPFRIQGNGIDQTAVTQNGGQVQVDNLRPGVYTVTEGTAQGDASLTGAVYGVYKGEQLIDSYTTDKNGQFSTKTYICGDDWSLREISASEGYLLNTESLHIGAEAKLYTAEFNLAPPLDSYETVKKGKIALIKHCDDGSTQIETPEVGATFEVFGGSSYADSKDTERDILICDKYGFAESKLLPYGRYTVKQTKGWEGKVLMPAFDVFIAEDGEIYRFLINNATFESLIEIVKKDAETGKIIPAAGIGFKVRDLSTGDFITQHINYPTPVDIDTFYTDSTGKLMLPEPLAYGNFELIEQCTAYGYVLDSSPVPFTVDGSQTFVTVEKHNIAQKGTITVDKTGEIFSSVAESNGIYQPVYDTAGLADAIYEVYADEDIVTLDGTVRAKKDDLVATIKTGWDGFGTSGLLYLGKYRIIEKKAPYSMVINIEPQFVELTYAGETVEITAAETAFYNERQKAEISLSKILEQNELFGIGNNGEILSVQFGLFADEDLLAADGSVIPKDGLLEIVNCDENGDAMFKTDIPAGARLYVKEIAVDSHYVLSDKKFPVVFEYADQETELVEIKVNDGEAIKNEILYGSVKGLKINRENEEAIAGALFGLFRPDETEFTAEKAILTAESGEDGIFIFENVPYGNWLIKELQPAPSFLPNEEIYPISITKDEEIIEITVVNDRIPEIGTTAAVDGEKEICATEVFTLEDTVSYKHLIPGKEYVLEGVLMDKATGKLLLIDGKEIRSTVKFIPEEPSGEITVPFTLDAKFIKAETDIVVFESLFLDGKELAVHTDIEDENQTVKVHVPEIRTQATTDGKKEVTSDGRVVIEDIVSYKNLTPGKEYTVKGILMDKGRTAARWRKRNLQHLHL